MIKIDVEKFIKDRIWYGWYWTGTVFPNNANPYWCNPYWCKLSTSEYEQAIATDVRGFKVW